MAKFLVTFMSSGALTVEAETEDEAREIFERDMQAEASNELKLNGIDISEVSEQSDD